MSESLSSLTRKEALVNSPIYVNSSAYPTCKEPDNKGPSVPMPLPTFGT